MAGFVAAGLLRGDHPQMHVEELAERPNDNDLLLDVRTVEEFDRGHISGSINIPVDELRSRLDELPRDRRIIAYCKVGMRGYLATRVLLQEGFNAVNLSGGYTTFTMLDSFR